MPAFAVFDLEPKFAVDLADLELRFLKLSRTWHPDRHVRAPAQAQAEAAAKMGAINEAYETLRDPDARRRHLIAALTGADPARRRGHAAAALPAAATAWFDVQDRMSEDPVDGRAALAEFRTRLAEWRDGAAREIARAEARWDAGERDAATLADLERAVDHDRYLETLAAAADLAARAS